MFKNKDVAIQVNKLILAHQAELSQSMDLVRSSCTDDEADVYRRALGNVLGYMLTEIIMPIHENHPELKPPELKSKSDKLGGLVWSAGLLICWSMQ